MRQSRAVCSADRLDCSCDSPEVQFSLNEVRSCKCVCVDKTPDVCKNEGFNDKSELAAQTIADRHKSFVKRVVIAAITSTRH